MVKLTALVEEAFLLLGLKVKDKVTEQFGVATSISFDLYGCVQILINPPVRADGTKAEAGWYDMKRLIVLDNQPIMELPQFIEVPGGELLPLQ
jgi:hypothetical protein